MVLPPSFSLSASCLYISRFRAMMELIEKKGNYFCKHAKSAFAALQGCEEKRERNCQVRDRMITAPSRYAACGSSCNWCRSSSIRHVCRKQPRFYGIRRRRSLRPASLACAAYGRSGTRQRPWDLCSVCRDGISCSGSGRTWGASFS